MIGRHHVVCHHMQEYVSPDDPNVHTNTVEGFFSLIKREIYGVYHNVLPEHLHRYVSEFAFRYNTRTLDDGARMRGALRSDTGKLSLESYRDSQLAG